MTAYDVELFVLNASALVSVLHALTVVISWTASSQCEEFRLHILLVLPVGLAEEVGELLIGEDLLVHAIDDGIDSGCAAKSFVKCHIVCLFKSFYNVANRYRLNTILV